MKREIEEMARDEEEHFLSQVVHTNGLTTERKNEIYRSFKRKLDHIVTKRFSLPTTFWAAVASITGGAVGVIIWGINAIFQFITASAVLYTAPICVASIAIGLIAGLGLYAAYRGLKWLYNTDAVQECFIRWGFQPGAQIPQEFVDRGEIEILVYNI